MGTCGEEVGPATSPLLTGPGGWKVLKEPALRDENGPHDSLRVPHQCLFWALIT